VLPVELMGVEVDIGVDGGVSGNAALGSAIVILGSGPADEERNDALAQGGAPLEAAIREPLAWLGRARRTRR
jgi:hypothetical protein